MATLEDKIFINDEYVECEVCRQIVQRTYIKRHLEIRHCRPFLRLIVEDPLRKCFDTTKCLICCHLIPPELLLSHQRDHGEPSKDKSFMSGSYKLAKLQKIILDGLANASILLEYNRLLKEHRKYLR